LATDLRRLIIFRALAIIPLVSIYPNRSQILFLKGGPVARVFTKQKRFF